VAYDALARRVLSISLSYISLQASAAGRPREPENPTPAAAKISAVVARLLRYGYEPGFLSSSAS